MTSPYLVVRQHGVVERRSHAWLDVPEIPRIRCSRRTDATSVLLIEGERKDDIVSFG